MAEAGGALHALLDTVDPAACTRDEALAVVAAYERCTAQVVRQQQFLARIDE